MLAVAPPRSDSALSQFRELARPGSALSLRHSLECSLDESLDLADLEVARINTQASAVQTDLEARAPLRATPAHASAACRQPGRVPVHRATQGAGTGARAANRAPDVSRRHPGCTHAPRLA